MLTPEFSQAQARTNTAARLAATLAAVAALLTAGCGRAPAPAAGAADTRPQTGSEAPQTPAQPGPNQKSYLIRSFPLGAQIYVDGKLIGTSPAKYYGPLDGQHLAFASLEGYTMSSTFMALEGDETTIDLIRAERATEAQRQAVANRNLLPAMAALQTDAGQGWSLPAGGGAAGSGIISPDGHYLATTAYTEEGLARRQDLIVLDLQKGGAKRVATRTYERYPFDSDGGSFGFYLVGWAGPGQLVALTQRTLPDDPNNPALSVLRLDLVTGEQKVIGDLGRSSEGSLYVKNAWLTSDGRGAFVHLPGRLLGLDVARGGSPMVELDLPGYGYDGMFWVKPSPDGWSVAYQAMEGSGENRIGRIYAVDLKTGQRQAVSSEQEYAERISWSPDSRRLAYGVGFRRADGSFPTYPGEDSNPLVADALEIADLPANWHTADEGQEFSKRQVKVAGSSVDLVGWNSPGQMLLATVSVKTGGDAMGWSLKYKGLAAVDPVAGKVRQLVALSTTLDGYIEAARADGGGYLISHAGDAGYRTLRLGSDGTVSAIGASVPGSREILQSSDAPWLVEAPSGGLTDATGRRVLPPTPGEGSYFLMARGGGWLALTRSSTGPGERFYILPEPAQ